jgi:hypothetical protein
MALSGSVERSIAEGVSAVLDNAADDSHRAEAFSDALGRMFEQLLAGAPSWSPYWWIDGALPELVTRLDDSTVEIAGTFVPSDERHQWIQPFRTTLSVDASRSRVVDYKVFLGDEDVAIDAVPWGGKRPKHWPDVTRWAYVFAGPN